MPGPCGKVAGMTLRVLEDFLFMGSPLGRITFPSFSSIVELARPRALPNRRVQWTILLIMSAFRVPQVNPKPLNPGWGLGFSSRSQAYYTGFRLRGSFCRASECSETSCCCFCVYVGAGMLQLPCCFGSESNRFRF